MEKLNLEGAYGWPEQQAEYYRQKKWWLDLTWADILDRNVGWYPDRIAIIDDTTRLTWTELRDKVDRLAWTLKELGVKKNDRIIVQIMNSHDYLVAFLAMARIGAVELQALTNHGEREISHFINMTDAVAWIVSLDDKKKDLRGLINAVKPKFPGLKHILAIGDNIPEGCLDYNKLIAEATPPKDRDYWDALRPDPNHVYLIGLTGGTTGLSKGVPRTYNDHILDGYGWDKSQECSSSDVGMVVTPFGHNLAHVCVLFPMLLEAATTVVANVPNPDRTMEIIEKEKVTFFWCVPTQLVRILNSPNFDKYNLSSLRFIGSGGAHVPAELVRGVNERIGCDFVNGFGMIEGPCSLTRLYDTFEAKMNTIGISTCPYIDFKIIDPVTEEELPRGKEGEMVCAGAHIMQGYYNTPREGLYTKDGYFRSGDLAKMDEIGRLSITGRLKDVINRGGEKISATEIEEILIKDPRIAESAVVAMTDKDMGERVCAFVMTKDGTPITLEDVQKIVEAAGLARFQWPERVECIDSLPLTNVGKPDKKKMRVMIDDKLKAEGKL
jgi:2,3-dihydroxybenzoate-AMP ligase